MLRAHATYQSDGCAVSVGILLNFQRHAGLPNDSRLIDGNPRATRNQLSRRCLALEVRLQFQLSPKIRQEAIRLSLALDLDLKLLTSVLMPRGLSEDE